MAHLEQKQYCERIRKSFPNYFKNAKVLDVGSLDINGCNRPLFSNSIYTGIDIGEGRNVDVVSKGHEFSAPDGYFDTIISTECFEHDKYIDKTLKNIVRMLKPGGLFVFTCATTGRPEHGTRRTDRASSPLTTANDEWDDYYKNLTEEDFREMLDIDEIFSSYQFTVVGTDIQFWGIKDKRINLPNVTLVIVDCVNYERAIVSLKHNLTFCKFGAVKFLTHFDVDSPYVVKIPKIKSIDEYSKFMVERLVDYIETDYVMVTQWDGFIVNGDMWDNRFLEYDYIGAPWPQSLLGEGIPKEFVVGNGGFSIRSRRLLQVIQYNLQWMTKHRLEDAMICQWNRAFLESLGIRFAPEDLASKFSIENGELRDTFGTHARYKLVRG